MDRTGVDNSAGRFIIKTEKKWIERLERKVVGEVVDAKFAHFNKFSTFRRIISIYYLYFVKTRQHI